MATERGQELMIQRSIQSEGTFGQLKEDYSYTRLRRRGKDGVEFELWMVAAGHNIRHYCNRKSQMKERSSHLN
ncbi:transposase, partial [Faecalibaculum rodentium]